MGELTAMLSISRPSAHYRAHADFMGIGVTADADIDIHDVQIYMDATATLTAEGILEGGLELLVDFVDTFFRDWIKDLVEGPLRDLIQDLLNDIHFPFINFLINHFFG